MTNQCGCSQSSDDIISIQRITWMGLAVNLFLAAVKFVTGIYGSSQAVVADAVHSLSDLGTDLAVILGIKYWTAPADEDHPYGHGRIETIVTAAIGIFLAAAAIGIGYNSLTSIKEPTPHAPTWIALLGSLFSIILKEILYHWTVKIGRQTRSSALIANAWHHRTDAISSIPALAAVAVAVVDPDWAFIDHVGALMVAVIILKVAWSITRPALHELGDQGASEKECAAINEVATGVGGVKTIHAVRSRKVGAGWFVDLHIQVKGTLTVHEGHEISGAVKHALLDGGLDIVDVVVHLEPYEESDIR
jgi:cation diffusion facilitator family transporter